MKNVIVLLFVLVPILGIAQLYNCPGNYFKVIAPSGLNMRQEPNLDAEKVFAIPFGESVYACEGSAGRKEVIEEKEGVWKKVFYGDHEGYVFSGFLEEEEKINVSFSSDWMNEWGNPIFPKGLESFGIYQDDRYSDRFHIQKLQGVDTIVNFTQYDDSGNKTIKQKEGVKIKNDVPYFYITGLPMKDGQVIESVNLLGRYQWGEMLYPGEVVGLGDFLLFAEGNNVRREEALYPFGGIKNYKLILRHLTNVMNDEGDITDQVLLNLDIRRLAGMYEDRVYVRWFGILDNDDKPDLVVVLQTHHACWEVILLLSTKATKGYLVGEAARQEVCGC